MKLDFDIVRKVLIEIENIDSLNKELIYKPNSDGENVIYALIKLEEANMINCHVIRTDNGIVMVRVFSLTWQGHQLLDDIRSSKAFNFAKSKLKDVGSFSISILGQVASQYLLNQLGL